MVIVVCGLLLAWMLDGSLPTAEMPNSLALYQEFRMNIKGKHFV